MLSLIIGYNIIVIKSTALFLSVQTWEKANISEGKTLQYKSNKNNNLLLPLPQYLATLEDEK